MRQGQQNRRGRGRNNNNGGGNNNNNNNRKGQNHHNPLMRTFQSNGPDQKIHGTPAQIADKYMSLARDALSSGDPVLAENYLQHAEHYNRIILTYREQQIQQGGGEPAITGVVPQRRPGGQGLDSFDGSDDGEDDSDGAADYGSGATRGQEMRGNDMRGMEQPRGFDQPQPRMDDRERQPRIQPEGYRDNAGREQGQREPREQGNYREQGQNRDGHARDPNNRDANRQFRPRMNDQRGYNQDRGDRNGEPRYPRADQGERNDRQPRSERNDRPDRFAAPERPDRPDRDRPDRDRQDRERPERNDRPERHDRPVRVDRGGDRVGRQDPIGSVQPVHVERELPFISPPLEATLPLPPPPPLPSSLAPPAPAVEPVAPTRRRERAVADPGHEQPDFLKRPVVRRTRREAAVPAADADAARPAPIATTDVPPRE